MLVFAAPDPPSLEAVRKASRVANENGTAVVLINPHVPATSGLGLNERRKHEEFFTKCAWCTASSRCLGATGTSRKRFPGLWRLYLQDETRPGRAAA